MNNYLNKSKKEKVPKVIEELVERFKLNLPAYKSQRYKEQQLREEFINPFFEALGWDVYNKSGAALVYRDVIHEDSIKMAGGTKAPDYCFTLAGTKMFFVETKKPSVDIKDSVHPSYQLRRYAWSAKLPLSILTDFEEFAVYESRKRPEKSDKASTERVLYLTYHDYIERWGEIANIFSKKAVLQGSFDRYIESVKGKRGTQEVDDAFLKEIEAWRESLAKNIALRNPELTVSELNHSVQRTIDRIIFLRMCEDRGIERYGNLRSLLEKDNIYIHLCEIYKKADEKYNSGIFHFQKEKNRNTLPDEITLHLHIDDKVIKEIINHIYYPESPYEFSVLSPVILGNVYEQFLGKVICLTAGHRAKIEEKPEVKKAGGVYYTPKYIVDYIVDNTVGRLIKGKTPKQISGLRILDPACGSGSFLLGAYTKLLDYHLKYYQSRKNPKRYRDQIFQGKNEEWYLTIKEKKRILLNNIYGVDVDNQAVEVTKLSLLLKVLEGESRDVFEQQQKLWQERALPDLGDNIKCGNSLIGPDFYNSSQTRLFDSEEKIYFINVLDWHREFKDVIDNGGFDAIIGNPPYVRSIWLKEFDPISWNYYRTTYQVAKEREFDIYLPFLEKGHSLLNDDGFLGFIMPNKWLHAKMGEQARNYFSKTKSILELINFKSFQIFKGATNYTMLIFLTGKENNYLHSYIYKGPTDKQIEADLDLKNKKIWEYAKKSYANLSNEPWVFYSQKKQAIINKLIRYPALKNFLKIMQGTGTRADAVFYVEILKENKDEINVLSKYTGKEYWIEKKYVKPSVKGKSIGRYQLKELNFALIFPYDGKDLIDEITLKNKSPKLWQYLRECKEKLEEREKGRWKGKGWYCYGRPQNHEFLPLKKIIIPAICNRAEATLDDIGYHVIDSVYLAQILDKSYHLNYFLALLNSKLLTFFLLQTGTNLRGNYFTMKTAYLYPFPIRKIEFSNQTDQTLYDKIVKLVEHMLNLNKLFIKAKTSNEKIVFQRQIYSIDKQIDQLVYQLYGITEDEKKIIEASI